MGSRRWWVALGLLSISGTAAAQLAPAVAYPIETAAPAPPIMQFEDKDRTTDVEIRVGADGRVITTRLLARSGNGVYDERVRGFWKHQPFVPAVDADGHAVESIVRARAHYVVKFPPGGAGLVNRVNGWRFRTELLDSTPDDMAARIERMRCGDLLREYDLMRRLAPRAKLQHEKIFHVAFAMFIAAKHLGVEARDSLIAQWDTLIAQTVDSCRAQPDAGYWHEAFAHTFESATPVGVKVD